MEPLENEHENEVESEVPKPKKGGAPKQDLDPIISTNRLAILAGMPRDSMDRRLVGVPMERQESNRNYYRLSTVLPILCRPEVTSDTAKKMAGHKERMAKADADSAENKANREAGILMLKSDAQRIWQDACVQIREIILKHVPKYRHAECSKQLLGVQLKPTPAPEL